MSQMEVSDLVRFSRKPHKCDSDVANYVGQIGQITELRSPYGETHVIVTFRDSQEISIERECLDLLCKCTREQVLYQGCKCGGC